MIMTIGVRVTMGQLSRRRIPDFGNTHSEVQAFARKRMIEIDIYHLAADFEDRDRSLSVISLQRGLHARLKSLGLIEDLLWQPGKTSGIIFLTPSIFETGRNMQFLSIAETSDLAEENAQSALARLKSAS